MVREPERCTWSLNMYVCCGLFQEFVSGEKSVLSETLVAEKLVLCHIRDDMMARKRRGTRPDLDKKRDSLYR